MSAEKNKAIQSHIFEEILNKGNYSIMDEVIAPNYVYHGPPAMPIQGTGPESLKQLLTMFRAAIPDFHCTVEDMIAEGDKVATRYTIRGTHTGEAMGIKPTGNRVEMKALVISRFKDGKEAEVWGLGDLLTMYQQLGVIPPLQQG